MSLEELLSRVRPSVERHAGGIPVATPGGGACILFFSVCDGDQRARVVHAGAPDFAGAWENGVARLQALVARRALAVRWLRVDWVCDVEASTWAALDERLARTKRNYFRHGIALDPELGRAFLEQELNANAMLYGGASVAHAQYNAKNFAVYAKRRYGLDALPERDPQGAVYLFSTAGVFCDGAAVHLLGSAGLDAGRRVLPDMGEADVAAMVAAGGDYLARQVGPNGRFDYGWFPCFDRPIQAYNALRHASSTYALLEVLEHLPTPQLQAAADRALHYLVTSLIRTASLPDGAQAAFLVDEGDEIKLGGNAVCLLALVKHAELTGADTYRALLEQLALGIRHMQDADSGKFVHVLSFPDLAVKQAFRIIYYDGEAAFGLMRLYALTGDVRWLAMVEKAFGYFIAAEHWKAHDHWLSYCVNELTRHRPEARYFRFGLANVADYLDFVLERETTFPTLLELMMAARQMLERLDGRPDLAHLLEGLDRAKFDRALEHRARYLANGHFWPELAMYFRNPARIVGSFFIRHHAFRVRIDDVEHYLSGLIAYLGFLRRGGHTMVGAESGSRVSTAAPAVEPPTHARRVAANHEVTGGPNWSAARLVRATGGRWGVPPASSRWAATGLCIWAPAMQAGNIVALRSEGRSGGVPAGALRNLPFRPQAVITSDPDVSLAEPVPVLEVADVNDAILKMGRFGRAQMSGRIVGVTGSAGKTTTAAMLAQVLRPWGDVGQTLHNANLLHGIAWNLASIPWSVPHLVIEMAIGRMQQNSALVRPHVAVFTNIAPAHLEYHGTTAEVARRKARIFSGMPDDGIAVINRDMDEWEIVHTAARERGVRIIHYGVHAECDVRLLEYDPGRRTIRAEAFGKAVSYTLEAPGVHMAMNSLACIATTQALGLTLTPVLAQLEMFRPLAGRGEIVDLVVDEKRLRVVDEAYNANPASMHAAIRLAGHIEPPEPHGRRVLILGDMLELGENSADLHAELAPHVLSVTPDLVLLCGKTMETLFGRLLDQLPVHWRPDAEALNAEVLGHLQDGDLVLVKSSGGTGLSETVKLLKARHSTASR